MTTIPTNLAPYSSPLDVSLFPTLSIGFLGAGILFVLWFFTYELTTTKKKEFTKEVTMAFWASVLTGFGALFMLLWTGVYV